MLLLKSMQIPIFMLRYDPNIKAVRILWKGVIWANIAREGSEI